MDVLLTGGSGQLGQSLRELDWPEDVRLHFPPRDALDLQDDGSIRAMLLSRPWRAILNVGAYTAVDAAEGDSSTAWQVNARAPELMAVYAGKSDIPIVHLSTDYVFSGQNTRPWSENDAVGPVNVYGASKEAGERAVRAVSPRHIILRTSWVVSPFGSNFLKTMLRLAAQKPVLRVVGDQVGRPTFANDLAKAIQTIVLQMIQTDHFAYGTYHIANHGETSWADFARAIFEVSSAMGGPYADVETIETRQYPTPARRPHYSTLSTSKFEQGFGLIMPQWREQIPMLMKALIVPQEKAK